MENYSKSPIGLLSNIFGSILVLVCMILDIMSFSKFRYSSQFLENFSNNLKESPLSDIIESISSCPSGYELLLNQKWPGYTDGCDCTNSWDFSISRTIHRQSCTLNETLAFCRDLPYTAPVDFSFYRGKILCKKREKLNYFKYLSENKISKDFNCPSRMKLCGRLDSTGNYLCLPETEKCPIVKIVIQDFSINAPNDKNYSKINLGNGKIIYFSNQNATKDDSIYTELKLSEDYPCLNYYRVNSRYRYSKYILDNNYDLYGCGEFFEGNIMDDRFVYLDSLNYGDLINDNRINYIISRYPQVPPISINFQVELYTRPYFGWKASCLKDKEYGIFYISELNLSLNSLYGKLLALMIISIITFVIYLTSFIFFCRKEPIIIIVFFIIIFILNFIMMILAFMTSSAGNALYKYNSELINLKCGDQYMNLFIRYLYNFVESLPSMMSWNGFLLIIDMILKILPFIFSFSFKKDTFFSNSD